MVGCALHRHESENPLQSTGVAAAAWRKTCTQRRHEQQATPPPSSQAREGAAQSPNPARTRRCVQVNDHFLPITMAGLRRREHKNKQVDWGYLATMCNRSESEEWKPRIRCEQMNLGWTPFTSSSHGRRPVPDDLPETASAAAPPQPEPTDVLGPESDTNNKQHRRNFSQSASHAMFCPSYFSDIKACHPDAGRIVLSKSYSKGDEPLTDAMIRRLDNDARRYQADREASEAADARIPATAAATTEAKPHVPKNRRKREARRAAERNAQE